MKKWNWLALTLIFLQGKKTFIYTDVFIICLCKKFLFKIVQASSFYE